MEENIDEKIWRDYESLENCNYELSEYNSSEDSDDEK